MPATLPDTLVTTYLEMTHPSEFKPFFNRPQNVRVEKLDNTDLPRYLTLYQSIGEKYRWRDRLLMPIEELRQALDRAFVFVLYVDNAPAGYVELVRTGASVEIAYFGLVENFQGHGLGKYLLSYGIDRAWKMGAERVWLHTCNLDGEAAMPNYLKRGFKVFREHQEPMPTRYL
jgi:GNAT superfamily N-acetyltransferase